MLYRTGTQCGQSNLRSCREVGVYVYINRARENDDDSKNHDTVMVVYCCHHCRDSYW